MSTPVMVTIVGTPVACKEGIKESWREVASWAAGQLASRFGSSVRVEYFDLFDPDCPPLPDGVQLPLVLVNSQILSSGEKISIPAIRRRLEGIGIDSLRRDQTSS